MATTITMPQLGETVTEGTVAQWLKKVGDTVDKYEPFVEVSTDKVNAEVPSPVTGVIREMLVKEGETVATGTAIAVIDEVGAAAPSAPAAAPAAPAQSFSPSRTSRRSRRARRKPTATRRSRKPFPLQRRVGERPRMRSAAVRRPCAASRANTRSTSAP